VIRRIYGCGRQLVKAKAGKIRAIAIDFASKLQQTTLNSQDR